MKRATWLQATGEHRTLAKTLLFAGHATHLRGGLMENSWCGVCVSSSPDLAKVRRVRARVQKKLIRPSTFFGSARKCVGIIEGKSEGEPRNLYGPPGIETHAKWGLNKWKPPEALGTWPRLGHAELGHPLCEDEQNLHGLRKGSLSFLCVGPYCPLRFKHSDFKRPLGWQ